MMITIDIVMAQFKYPVKYEEILKNRNLFEIMGEENENTKQQEE